MTTASQARAAVRSRIESGNVVDAGSQPVPFRWQNEAADSLGNIPLPDTPAPFVYVEFDNDGPGGSGPTAYGGGRGANLYRNMAWVAAYVLVPKDEGVNEAEAIAEQIAVLLRSHRDEHISCFEATVYPGGSGADLKLPVDVGNYFWAMCEARLWFDQIG